MSIEKLERVLWRLRKRSPDADRFNWNDLRNAIMLEIGTNIRTYRANKEALVRLKWIVSWNKNYFKITGKDLEDA